jgi:hypothetical protein
MHVLSTTRGHVSVNAGHVDAGGASLVMHRLPDRNARLFTRGCICELDWVHSDQFVGRCVALLDLERKPRVFCSWAGLTGCSGRGATTRERVDRDDDITGTVMGCYE